MIAFIIKLRQSVVTHAYKSYDVYTQYTAECIWYSEEVLSLYCLPTVSRSSRATADDRYVLEMFLFTFYTLLLCRRSSVILVL